MRRDPEYFGDRELELLYIAKKLNDALRIESLMQEAGIDYAVEADNYVGGVIFRSERIGAFFYVLPEDVGAARDLLERNRFRVS